MTNRAAFPTPHFLPPSSPRQVKVKRALAMITAGQSAAVRRGAPARIAAPPASAFTLSRRQRRVQNSSNPM